MLATEGSSQTSLGTNANWSCSLGGSRVFWSTSQGPKPLCTPPPSGTHTTHTHTHHTGAHSDVCVHSHTHSHPRRHTHIHTHRDTLRCVHELTYTHSLRHTHIHTHTGALRCVHALTYTLTHTQTHSHMHPHRCTLRCVHALTYTLRHILTHADAQTLRHTLRCMHTHAHTQMDAHTQKCTPRHMHRHTLRLGHVHTRMHTLLMEWADLVFGLWRPSSSLSQAEGTVCETFWKTEHTSSLVPAGAEPTLAGSSLPGALSSRLGVTFSRTRATELPPKGHSFDSRFCPVRQWPRVLGTGSTCLQRVLG